MRLEVEIKGPCGGPPASNTGVGVERDKPNGKHGQEKIAAGMMHLIRMESWSPTIDVLILG